MLYVVGTPIGNLGDISPRCAEILATVDLIAAEDTRHTGRLLEHLNLSRPLTSFQEHNEERKVPELLARLREGASIALVTDAGMPSVSDPGYRLVKACRDEGLPCTVIPGPSAVLTALAGSGFPSDRFYFGGFLPPKSGRRGSELSAAAKRKETSIFFESPHRLARTLAEAAPLLTGRRVCVARELTKKFEEFRIGTAEELAAHYESHPPKGEITLLISGLSAREARERGLQPHED
jgi:16S rRNA (cytidine1402-2'-O)-methyltransferase